jgi:hypothetical protein
MVLVPRDGQEELGGVQAQNLRSVRHAVSDLQVNVGNAGQALRAGPSVPREKATSRLAH